MRKSYDFSKARPNPYAKRLKKQVTIRLDEETIDYFKSLAEGTEIPYQTLINLYLRDCAQSGKRLRLEWSTSLARPAARRTSTRAPRSIADPRATGEKRARSAKGAA